VITVTGLFRYPVKSMQGLVESALDLGPTGFVGDREWALLDGATGRLMSAKRWSALLMAAADDEAITLPDGGRVELGSDGADIALSAWLGRDVRLVEASSATAVTYEMTFDPPDDSAEFVPIDAPPGTYFDVTAAHLMAGPTLRHAADQYGDLDWDLRRFRPNLVVDGDLGPLAEDEWVGRTLRIGEAELSVLQPTLRCAMPLRAQPGLERQAPMYAALEALHGNHLGLYLDVVTPGRIAVGDEVSVLA
jgi:uncharacterized protein